MALSLTNRYNEDLYILVLQLINEIYHLEFRASKYSHNSMHYAHDKLIVTEVIYQNVQKFIFQGNQKNKIQYIKNFLVKIYGYFLQIIIFDQDKLYFFLITLWLHSIFGNKLKKLTFCLNYVFTLIFCLNFISNN